MSKKWVYSFKEGDMSMRNLLGGKGANLAEMTSIGLPVPQGFTITTEACTQYYEDGRKINDEIMAQAMDGVAEMERVNGKKFGDLKNPLLVSVRSGARASMPGMMDTILNLGLNDEVVDAMIKGNSDPAFERFVYDSYRRFIQMFSDVVMEVGKKYFEQLIDKMKEEKGVQFDVDLTAADLKKEAVSPAPAPEPKPAAGTEFKPIAPKKVEVIRQPEEEARPEQGPGRPTEAGQAAGRRPGPGKDAEGSAAKPVEESTPAVDIQFASGPDNGRNSNERILELHKAGKSNMAIAKELGLGLGEVKLVIDLFEGM